MGWLDYRLQDRRVLDDADSDLAWAVVEPIWYFPWPRDSSSRRGWRWYFVSQGQLLVHAVTWLEREVCNGGFAQYFSNPAGHFFRDTLRGLDAFGLGPYAGLLEQAAARFPSGCPSLKRTEREDHIRRLAEECRRKAHEPVSEEDLMVVNDYVFHEQNVGFYNLYGEGLEFFDAMEAYIRAHPAEFFR